MPVTPPDRTDRTALAAGIGCYVLWGVFPLFWPLLGAASPVEVLAQRIVWSCVAAGLAMVVLRQSWDWLAKLRGRTLLLLVAASAVIAVNWGTFIYAVNTNHVVESSLGYFINPLVNLVLGRVLFGERLDRMGRVGAVLALIGVVVISIGNWRTLWISLLLAGSFGIYGALKKTVRIAPLPGLFVESGLMLVPSLIFLVIWEGQGRGHFVSPLWWLFIAGGVLTMVPLWLFAVGARGLPLGTLGILQYIGPTMQFLLGLIVFGQNVSLGYWVGIVIVWLGCACYVAGMWWRARRARLLPLG